MIQFNGRILIIEDVKFLCSWGLINKRYFVGGLDIGEMRVLLKEELLLLHVINIPQVVLYFGICDW